MTGYTPQVKPRFDRLGEKTSVRSTQELTRLIPNQVDGDHRRVPCGAAPFMLEQSDVLLQRNGVPLEQNVVLLGQNAVTLSHDRGSPSTWLGICLVSDFPEFVWISRFFRVFCIY